MKRNRTLYLFTATYPYGTAEVFLEEEIGYLSRAFLAVVIVPLSGHGVPTRAVPENVVVLPPVLGNRYLDYLKGFIWPKAIATFIPDFFKNKVYANKQRLKAWAIMFAHSNVLLSNKTITGIFKSIGAEDVCYFYWGKGSNILSWFYRGKSKFVSRFHGEWDLWEESSGSYAPIRNLIANSLDRAVFISSKGESYFKERYPECTTSFIPLGSGDYGIGKQSEDGILRVVSCSSVYPLKRVPLIFEAVRLLKDIRVCWTHLGGGSDFDQLNTLVEESKTPNLQVHLIGQVSHDEVIKYYQTHPVDVFVNVSTNEGVPVSIMEALSFNIPVVATNVGGNPEIVTEESGVLVDSDPSAKQVAQAILSIKSLGLNPRNFWNSHYSAVNNYQQMTDLLLNI